MPDDGLERVAVLRSDLELWQRALDRAFMYAFAQDLAAGYRDLRQDAARSKITNMLEIARDKAVGYTPPEEPEQDLWVPGQ